MQCSLHGAMMWLDILYLSSHLIFPGNSFYVLPLLSSLFCTDTKSSSLKSPTSRVRTLRRTWRIPSKPIVFAVAFCHRGEGIRGFYEVMFQAIEMRRDGTDVTAKGF
jgi:hypothetical protein